MSGVRRVLMAAWCGLAGLGEFAEDDSKGGWGSAEENCGGGCGTDANKINLFKYISALEN